MHPLSNLSQLVKSIEELSLKIEEGRSLRQQSSEQADALISAEITKLFTDGSKQGWKDARLGDYVMDDCYGTSEKTTDDRTGIPILRMGNIQNGRSRRIGAQRHDVEAPSAA